MVEFEPFVRAFAAIHKRENKANQANKPIKSRILFSQPLIHPVGSPVCAAPIRFQFPVRRLIPYRAPRLVRIEEIQLRELRERLLAEILLVDHSVVTHHEALDSGDSVLGG